MALLEKLVSPVGGDLEYGKETQCAACGAKFTMTHRRHHCRFCNKAVCGTCSKGRRRTPDGAQARACDSCKGESPDEESGDSEEITVDCCKSLTKKQRFIGFGVCFVLGWLMTILSSFSFFSVINGNTATFAVVYTLGNMLSLSSTFFFWGPVKQLKRMFDKERRIASIIYLAAMALTLILAFATKGALLIIICMVFQMLAMIWYCASYFPGARLCIKKTLTGCIKQ